LYYCQKLNSLRFIYAEHTKYERYLINGRKKETIHGPQRCVDHVVWTEARGDREYHFEKQDGEKGRSSTPFVSDPTEHDVAEETTHVEERRRRGRPPAVVTYQV